MKFKKGDKVKLSKKSFFYPPLSTVSAYSSVQLPKETMAIIDDVDKPEGYTVKWKGGINYYREKDLVIYKKKNKCKDIDSKLFELGVSKT